MGVDGNTFLDSSTGILLTPSYHGEKCMGNGERLGYECCCDECNFYLQCIPDWNETGFGEY